MEIVFFAVVALLVLGRLFQVLGQNKGARPDIIKNNITDFLPKTADSYPFDLKADDKPLPSKEMIAARQAEKYGELYPKVAQIKAIDSSFDIEDFEANSSIAYDAIINAYSTSDFDTLKPLVSDNIYQFFKNFMEERKLDNSSKIDVIKLKDPELKAINLNNKVAQIDVLFDATLVEAKQKPHNAREIWTFERNLELKDPIWKLIAVEKID